MMSSNRARSRSSGRQLHGAASVSRFCAWILLIGGLLMLARPVHAAQMNTASLRVGDVFPQYSGQTLTGKPFSFAGAATNKSAVLVFSFSRKAATDARLWNEHLSKDFPAGVRAYGIIMLESVPKPLRKMAVSGIKGSMPPSVQDRTIVSYRDEELWKQRLTVMNGRRAYVLLLGSDGHIQWMNAGAFTDAEYARLKNRVSGLLPSHK